MTSFYLDSENPGNKIINPRNLAIAASIGIHGLLLAAVVPNTARSSEDPAPRDLRNVGVVELNEFERSRLPELNPAAAPLPELPPTDTPITALPELPPLGSLDTALPPSLPSLPALPPLPSSYSVPPLNVYSPPITSLPPSRPLSVPRVYNSNLPAPPPVPSIGQPSPSNLPRANRPNFDPYQDNLTLNGIRNAPARASQQAIQGMTEPVAINADPRPGNERARARSLWSELEARQRSLEADGSNTTDDEAMRNQVAWLAKVKETNPEALNSLASADRENKGISIVNLIGNYPVDACSRKLAGTAVYGVTVNGAGVPVSEPKLIKSAGFPILNQQAARQLRFTRLENSSGAPRIYQVRMSFAPTPDACRGAIAAPRDNGEAPSEARTTTPVTPEIPTRPRTAPSPAVNPRPATPEAQPAPSPAAVVEPKAPETPPEPVLKQPETPPESVPTTRNPEPAPEALGEAAPAVIEPLNPPAETKPAPEPSASPEPAGAN